MKSLFRTILGGLLIVLCFDSQPVNAQAPVRFDTDYLYELLVSNPHNEFLPVSEENLLWRLEQLSGSWRFICPASDVALRFGDGDVLETGEVNGSDEAQLWRIERSNEDGVYLVSPANVANSIPYRFRIVQTKEKTTKAGSGTTTGSQRNIWEDETVFAINKEDGVATYMPYPTEAAMMADSAFYAKPWLNPEKNERYQLLNGTWKFRFVPEPSQRPMDFF